MGILPDSIHLVHGILVTSVGHERVLYFSVEQDVNGDGAPSDLLLILDAGLCRLG